MHDIYNSDGELIAAIPLSERSLELLDAGSAVTIQYHTPIMARGTLGERSGQFVLSKQGEQITADDPKQVASYADLQVNIVAQRAP